MQEGHLLMTQADRDRLVALRKAKKKLITQREAAEELGLSVRQVKRLLYALKKHGDKAVIHGPRQGESISDGREAQTRRAGRGQRCGGKGERSGILGRRKIGW